MIVNFLWTDQQSVLENTTGILCASGLMVHAASGNGHLYCLFPPIRSSVSEY